MTQTACPHCALPRQPEHFGSPRRCAFKGEAPDTPFTGDNWQCGLAGRVRDLMRSGRADTWAYRNDLGPGSVGAVSVSLEEPDGHSYRSGLLVASWYKNRGETEDIRWAYEDARMGQPVTLEEVQRLLAEYPGGGE